MVEAKSFNDHIDKAISKASSMLGFIIRFSKEFDDPYTLKILYTSYVRSHLEYASVIWNPYYENKSARIESIQKRFLIFALRHHPRDVTIPRYILPPYNSRCALLNPDSLSNRRSIASAMFIYDLLTGRIDSPDILMLLSIYVPTRRLRSRQFSIQQQYRRTNYGRSEPVFTTSCDFNSVVDIFDFCITRKGFRDSITIFFRN